MLWLLNRGMISIEAGVITIRRVSVETYKVPHAILKGEAWIKVWGSPPHKWNPAMGSMIGDKCGGYLDAN